ncbi:hypothetical protein BKA62DRAFT_741863 [Auriculariales sp. MPI-PUGE-AT-0066]|nr:hypothetical protein BKA62DRAFT_741863 [Auriculariales sp. MPI-PUGE-AT-0066]
MLLHVAGNRYVGYRAISVLAEYRAGLDSGFLTFTSQNFTLQLVNASQTLYSLKTVTGFDFIPSDRAKERQFNGQYHLGDIRFKARVSGATDWASGDSALARQPVTALLTTNNSVLAASDLTPTLPADSLLGVNRSWLNVDGHLRLIFDIVNLKDEIVEIGSLAAPLEFNNIFTSRKAPEMNEKCSLFDPSIAAAGNLPPLLVLPVGDVGLEGWGFLQESDDAFHAAYVYQAQTFEGEFEWQFHTAAETWVESVIPWNEPTSVQLQPGERRTYGLEFRIAPSVRQVEATLQDAGRPLAIGIPGYVVQQGQAAKLFLSYSSSLVVSIYTTPSHAIHIDRNSDSRNPTWNGYTLTPARTTFGRVRLTVEYANGQLQTVHYYVTKEGVQTVSDLGNFLFNAQWFDDPADPFHRSPSIMGYDRQLDQILKDERRNWLAGLSDEGGAGPFLAAAMKQYVSPVATEVAKLERFVNETMWCWLQNSTDFTVKKSLYFYEPALVPGYAYPELDWSTGWKMNSAYGTNRAYNYVHVVATYWALYRVARNYPSLTTRTWEWYLGQASQTITAMMQPAIGYKNAGLMGETIFFRVLQDLQFEGIDDASTLEAQMRSRWELWSQNRYPFGSEMAWDSTGSEAVYVWSQYFSDRTTAANAVNAILGYDPLIPSWAYNGNARRYWDNVVAGKLQRIERQVHHYGSALNALPLWKEYQTNPEDLFLLRLAHAGLSAPTTNIDQDGFASASFHAWTDTLTWDAYSADYGPGFSGMAQGLTCVLIEHADFGWQVFGGKILHSVKNAVRVTVNDPIRRRIYIAPLGLLLELDAGAFDSFELHPVDTSVRVKIAAKTPGIQVSASAPAARLRLQGTTTLLWREHIP